MRAKPIVERLLDDPRVTLSPDEQMTVAVWAVKCAMVFEALRDQPAWFYTEDDRRSFLESFTIPPRTVVWIAKCVALPGIYCNATDHAESGSQTVDQTRLYVTTVAFGPVALQVATAKPPSAIPAHVAITTEVRPGPWEDATNALWPKSTEVMVWPPRVALNGELGLETFHTRWGEDSPAAAV